MEAGAQDLVGRALEGALLALPLPHPLLFLLSPFPGL